MFAKLSALALLLPLVSALSITCPPQVEVGAAVDIAVDVLATDPSAADFYLVGPGTDIQLSANVVLDATVTLEIPDATEVVVGAGFVIVATVVGDVNQPLAQTAPFITVDSDN